MIRTLVCLAFYAHFASNHAVPATATNLRGNNVLVASEDAEEDFDVVELVSSSAPLVPTSSFFEYGKGRKAKPQGDWLKNGEWRVHMSIDKDCTLTGGDGRHTYQFAEPSCHRDSTPTTDFCKSNVGEKCKCWSFPVCSPVNSSSCYHRHQKCHVLIMQTPGATYYHETLRKELSRTKWEYY